MQTVQMELVKLWFRAGDAIADAARRSRDDRGEVTSQTALIVILVVAALAAGVIIAAAIDSNASRIVPAPE